MKLKPKPLTGFRRGIGTAETLFAATQLAEATPSIVLHLAETRPITKPRPMNKRLKYTLWSMLYWLCFALLYYCCKSFLIVSTVFNGFKSVELFTNGLPTVFL